MTKRTLKLIGLTTTLVGAGISMVSSWVEEQKMKEEIHNEVERALAEKDMNETESM